MVPPVPAGWVPASRTVVEICVAPFVGHVVGQKTPASPPEELPLDEPLLDPELLPLEDPELLPLLDPELPPLEDPELLPLLDPELLPLPELVPPSVEGGVVLLETHANVMAANATNEPIFTALCIFLFFRKRTRAHPASNVTVIPPASNWSGAPPPEPPPDDDPEEELDDALPPGWQVKVTVMPEATPGMSIGAVPRRPPPECDQEPTT
jgi:hypothetical protein